MKRIAFVIVALALPFSFAGCGATINGQSPGEIPPVNVINVGKVSIDDGNDTYIFDVTLSDGTRCVVTDGYNAGGISCDWGN